MINEKLRGEDLIALQKEKGSICISVIVPAHRLSPERRGDKKEMENAIEKARRLLYDKYTEEKTEPLIRALNDLFNTIDFTHNAEGVGLFVSPRIQFSVQFHFPVQEKIMVADRFEIRDLLYETFNAEPYFILLLSEKGAGFFKGSGNSLSEIRDNNFPIGYEEEYAYAKPARSSSYSGHSHVKIYEKDKSEMEKIRLSDFFRKVDNRLEKYLNRETALVVCGVERELSLFLGVSNHKKNIAGKISGNYSHYNESELAGLVWPVIRLHFKERQKQLLKEFEEKTGQHLAISGIGEIWEATKEGKPFKLLVEKDFRVPGFIIENDHHLYLSPPQKPHKILPDTIDVLIELVLEKNGQVYFMDNGMLADYGRIALITRY
jgi:hypothetical protein